MRPKLRLVKIDSSHANVFLTIRGVAIDGIRVEQESWGPLRLDMPDATSIPVEVREEVTAPEFVGQLMMAIIARWPTAELAV